MSEETTEPKNVETTNDTEIVTEGSVRHNKALLDELKQARATLAAIEAERAERETAAAKKAGDYEGLLKKEQEKAAKLLKERDENLLARDAKIKQLLTDNAIKDVIGSYEVRPGLRTALVNHLKTMVETGNDGVTLMGKPAGDFGKAFFASEEGREWLKPVLNSGGGATGNAGSVPATPDKWNLSTYAQMKNEDPAMAAAYAKKHNKSF